jgi:phage terminase large subunit GpA-like protein
VYAYTKVRHPRVISIRGVGGIGHGIIVGGKRREGGSNVWIVRLGVDTLKDELFARLDIKTHGPGYCHYPMEENGMDCCGYSKDYFDQLTAEQRVLKYSKGGFAKYEWQKARTDANEALDIRNYNRAALEYLKVKLDQMPREVLSAKQLEQMKIEEIEVSGIKMKIDNREVQAQRRMNVKGRRYGGTTIEGTEGSLFAVNESRQQASSSTYRRTTPRYGSVGVSF